MFERLRFLIVLGGFTALGYGVMQWGASTNPPTSDYKPVMLETVGDNHVSTATVAPFSTEPSLENSTENPPLPRYMHNIATDGGIDVDADGRVISNQNLRDFFEFYLSLQGDFSLDDIERLLQRKTQGFDAENSGISSQVMQLFHQYIEYKTALSSLSDQSLSALELLAAKQQLQLQFFEPQQAEQLFGDENSYMSYGIYQYQQQGLEPEYQQQLSAEAADNMGFYDQQANQRYRQQQQQLKALADITDDSAEDRYVAREALVGKEAAERLQQLDQQRQQWQQKVSAYELKMAELSSLPGLAEQDIAEQQQRYIQQHFSASEQRRLPAAASL